MGALQKDLVAGFCVFLLALPLCLGIALASQFPPSAGIITAITGGIITAFFGGGKLTIKGPAAGLIVIVLGAVTELGQGDLVLGYKRALAVGVVAALLQIVIALRKKAIFAEIMPPSVIHGMLAAIGVIIIAKQMYVLIGARPIGTSIFSLLINFPAQIMNANPLILIIGAFSLLIVLLWPRVNKIPVIPASLVVVSLTVPLSLYFDIKDAHTYHLFYSDYILDHSLLVTLPNHFLQAITFPDFSWLGTLVSLKYIVMFTLVGTIESLLTVCAIDTLSKNRQPTDLNQDLLGLGIANLCAALLGGLPMIAEIVRSKANLDYGARSEKSNLFHGLWMLLAALVLTPYINLIPLSALAALLISVGCKLASPKAFVHAYKIGQDQALLFFTTFILTLTHDLLTGVLAGITLKLLIHLLRGNTLWSLFKPSFTVEQQGEMTTIFVSGPVTFISYLRLKRIIQNTAAHDQHITLNFSKTHFIDHTMMSKLHALKESALIMIQGLDHLKPFSEHNLSTRQYWAS